MKNPQPRASSVQSKANGKKSLPEKIGRKPLPQSNEKEIWKPVLGYEGLYEVSSFGRVKRIGKCTASPTERILKSVIICGYLVVRLSKKGKGKMKTVHSLLANAFIKIHPAKTEVNHKNGIKTDNRPENLEWVTRGENIRHAYKNGLMPIGENHCNAKLKNHQVLEIRKLASLKQISLLKISKMFSVSQTTIFNVCSRKIWKHV